MDIVNQKQIKKFLIIVVIITFCLTIIPLALYYSNFKDFGISDSPNDWGIFGSYFGGIVGTIFNLVAAFFMLVSIYITLKIATKIQENEKKFNKNRLKKENEKFKKEIELTHKQNKPFPYFELTNFPDKISIILCNYGIGPLIVKKIEIIYSEIETYPHIAALILEKIGSKPPEIYFFYNSAPLHIIPPKGSKELAIIRPQNESNIESYHFQSACREVLKDSKIKIEYEDIFENKNEMLFKLEFLHN